MKTCTKCQVEKPLDQFYKEPRGKDGLFARCKTCHLAATANWQKNNRDKVNGIARRYYQNNRETIARKSVEYYEKNRSTLLSKKKERRQLKRDEISEYQKEWYRRNPNKFSEYAHRRRVRLASGDVRRFTETDWRKLLHRFDNRCAYCGSDGELTKDHVVPISRGGRHAVGNIVPACWQCNMSKGTKFLVEWRKSYGLDQPLAV